MYRLSFLLRGLPTTFSLVVLIAHGVCVFAQQPPSWEALRQVADGKADATIALQQLLDDSVGSLQLPPGTFRLTKTIEIDLASQGYVTIEGSSATTLVMTVAGPAIRFKGSHFKSAAPSGFSSQVWEKERMPFVRGLAITGTHPEADGIQAAGTMQLTVAHVHLRGLRHGIHLVENNRNVLIDACHIYENTGIGIFYDDVNLHQSNIVGCHISYCAQGGIVSRQGNVRNIHISGCDLESNMSATAPPTANILIDCRGSDYGTAEVAITGCTIQHNDAGPDSSNIRIIGSSNPPRHASAHTGNLGPSRTQEGNITITGNVLSDVQTNVWLESCRGVTLTGNTFWMGFEHNLLIDDCSHIVMAANNFDRNPRYAYGHSLSAKNRLLIRSSRDCTLTGIHISDVTGGPALTLENCDRFNVSALTILDCEVGLHLKNVTRSLFSGCLIRDDRDGKLSRTLVISGGSDNQMDASLTIDAP